MLERHARWFVCLLAVILLMELVRARPAAAEDAGAGWVDPGWRRTRADYHVVFEASGSTISTYTFAFTATDERGVTAIAQQAFNYDDAYDAITVEDLATHKRDGRVLPVDPRAIGDQSRSTETAAPYFDARRTRIVAFPDVAAGDSVRGRVTLRSKRAPFEGEFERVWAEAASRPPETVRITIDGPASKPLRASGRGAAIEEEQRGDRRILRAVVEHTEPHRAPANLSGFDGAQRLEVSTFPDYRAFAAAMHARNASAARPTAAVAEEARRIAGEAATMRERVERTHNWVTRNLRYVGIGLDDGGLTSRPAAETLAARYGDCKAHATLLIALLAAQGIEAELVLINAEPRYTLTEVATANFDHAIVRVPALDVYLDPTAPFAFPSLPPTLRGKPVLNVDRGTLDTIPPMRSEDLRLETGTDYELHPDGRRTARTILAGEGVGATLVRTVAERLEGMDRTRAAAERLSAARLKGTGTYRFGNPRDLADRFEIEAPFEIKEPLTVSAATMVRALPLTNPLPLGRVLASKDGDYACLPLSFRDEASLALPPGINVYQRSGRLTHEADFTGTTDYGEVHGRVAASHEAWIEDRIVRTRSTFTVTFDAAVCPALFAGAIRAGLDRFDALQRQPIGLTYKSVKRVIEGGSPYDQGLTAYHDRLYERALAILTPLAEAGDADAGWRVGTLYRDGRGTRRDLAQARGWFLKAAAAGSTQAQIDLAYQLRTGAGGSMDLAQAVRWYQEAAREGSSDALYSLGHLYAFNKGMVSDGEQALRYFTAADEAGELQAAGAIGRLYEIGGGLPQDYVKAAEWYRRGARRGDPFAQTQFGRLSAEGLGVEKDLVEAFNWTRKAAEQGDVTAEHNLGWIYEAGLAVPRNVDEALIWYDKSAAQGNADARARASALRPGTRQGGLLSQAYRWLRAAAAN